MEGTRKATSSIPVRALRDEKIPAIGFGTFSARLSSEVVADAVHTALREGYRFLDCAAAYGNEAQIGEVLKQAIGEGIPREELFVLSKLRNEQHGMVEQACENSMRDLCLAQLDAYLIHWPVPNALSPRASEGVYDPDSRPYRHSEFMKTWRSMEKLVLDGKVRHIGVSNVTIAKLKLLLRDAQIKPSICEMEIHPNFQQGELFQFCLDHDILPVAYSPMGAPRRPERNCRPTDFVDMEDPAVVHVARAHGVHPGVVCIKWAFQRGQIPIPFSSNPDNIRANLQAVLADPLTDEEMDMIRASDRNCRLSRGDAYLWKGARSYLELWDVNEAEALQKLDV